MWDFSKKYFIFTALFFSACGGGEENNAVSPSSAQNEDVVGFWWTHTPTKPQEGLVADWDFQIFSFQEHSEETGLDWSFIRGDQNRGDIGTYELRSGEIVTKSATSGETKGYNIKELIPGEKMRTTGFPTGESTLLYSERCSAPGNFGSFITPGLTVDRLGPEEGPVAWAPDGELHAGGMEHFVTHKKWCALKPAAGFPRAMDLIINDKGEGFAADWTEDGSIEVYEFDSTKPDQRGSKHVAGSVGRALNLQDEMTSVLRPDGRPIFITTAGQQMFEKMPDGTWKMWAGIPLSGVVSQGVRATMHPDGRMVLLLPNLSILPIIESAPGSQELIPYNDIPNPRLGRTGDNLNIMYAFDDDGTLYAVYSEWFKSRRPDELFELAYADAFFLAKWNGSDWERTSLGIGNPYEFVIKEGVAKIASVTFRSGGLFAYHNVDLKTGDVEIQTRGQGLVKLEKKYGPMVQTPERNHYPRTVFGPNKEIANAGTSWSFSNEGAPTFKVPLEFTEELSVEIEIAGQKCSKNCEIDLAYNTIYPIHFDTPHNVEFQAVSTLGLTNTPIFPLIFEPNLNDFWLVSTSPWNMKIRITVTPNLLIDPIMTHEPEVDGIVSASLLNSKGEQITFYTQSIDTPCGGVSTVAVRLNKKREIVARECLQGIKALDALALKEGIAVRVLSPEPSWVLLNEDDLTIKKRAWKLSDPKNSALNFTVKAGRLIIFSQGFTDRLPRFVFFDDKGDIEKEVNLPDSLPLFTPGSTTSSLSLIGDKYVLVSPDGKVRAFAEDGSLAWTLGVSALAADSIDGVVHVVGNRGEVEGQMFASAWHARFDSAGNLLDVKEDLTGKVVGVLRALDSESAVSIASNTVGTAVTKYNIEGIVFSVGWSVNIAGLGLGNVPNFRHPVFVLPDGDLFRLAFTNAVGAINPLFFVNFGKEILPPSPWPTAWAATLQPQ